MNYIQQSDAAGRHLMPDLVRAFAIIGIALVNVGLISYSNELSYFEGGFRTSTDHFAHFLVNAIFTAKSYTLFSFMFGVGFAYQMKSANRAGASFKRRYFRRTLGLFIIGFLHIALAFQGDILVVYALLGMVLYLYRNASLKKIITTALVLIGLQIIIICFMAFAVQMGLKYAPADMQKEMGKMNEAAAHSLAVFQNGGFGDASLLRLTQWVKMIGFLLFLHGTGVMGAFLLGLAAVKSDLIANPDAPIWRKFRRLYLPVGILGSVIAAYMFTKSEVMLSAKTMWGMALLFAAAPLSSAGYLGLIAKWVQGPTTRLKIFMARGGTATLSSYLMQSILLSLIFNNYGFGLYAQLGAAACIGIGLCVAVFTLVFSSLWRKKFSHGPAEYVLRKFTYG